MTYGEFKGPDHAMHRPDDPLPTAPAAAAETAAPSGRLSRAGWCWLAAYAVSRLVLLLGVTPLMSDVFLYNVYAYQWVDLGGVPYRDYKVEYPPLALWAMALPALLDGQEMTWELMSLERRDATLAAYVPWFRAQMALADLAALALLALAVRRTNPAALTPTIAGYTLVTALSPHVVYDRVDAGLVALVMLWLYAMLRPGARRPAPLGWVALAYAALGLAIGYKLIPVVAAPFVVLCDLADAVRVRGGWLRLTVGLGTLGVTLAGPLAWHIRQAGGATFGFLTYHAERFTQIESVGASVALLARGAGLAVQPVYDHGSWNLRGPVADALAGGSNWLLLAALAVLGSLAVGLAWQGRYDRPAAARFGAAAMALSVVFAKVFSAQFVLWSLPLLVWLATESRSRRTIWGTVAVASAMAALTTWVFPYHYLQLIPPFDGPLVTNPYPLVPAPDPAGPSLHPVACGALVARNGLYVGTVAWLTLGMLRRAWRDGEPASGTLAAPATQPTAA